MRGVKYAVLWVAAVLAWMLVLLPLVNMWAQTPTTPTRAADSQVKAPPTQLTAIWVVTPNGKILVQPDATIQIDLLATPPTIRAVAPPAAVGPREWADQYVVPAGGQTAFTLTYTPVLQTFVKVYRNGLLQWQSVDYSLIGQTVGFLPGQGTAAGDLIQIWYWKAGS